MRTAQLTSPTSSPLGRRCAPRWADAPMNPRRAVELCIQMADALADGHAAGIIHGDLRPETVVVTGKGSAKLLDFGMWRWTRGGLTRRARRPRAGVAAGRRRRDRRLHGAGTGARRPDRRPRRPVLARHDPLRDAHRAKPVRRHVGVRHGHERRPDFAAAAVDRRHGVPPEVDGSSPARCRRTSTAASRAPPRFPPSCAGSLPRSTSARQSAAPTICCRWTMRPTRCRRWSGSRPPAGSPSWPRRCGGGLANRGAEGCGKGCGVRRGAEGAEGGAEEACDGSAGCEKPFLGSAGTVDRRAPSHAPHAPHPFAPSAPSHPAPHLSRDFGPPFQVDVRARQDDHGSAAAEVQLARRHRGDGGRGGSFDYQPLVLRHIPLTAAIRSCLRHHPDPLHPLADDGEGRSVGIEVAAQAVGERGADLDLGDPSCRSGSS